MDGVAFGYKKKKMAGMGAGVWEKMNLGFSVIKGDNKIESMTVGIKRI